MGRLQYTPSQAVVDEAKKFFHDMHFNSRYHIHRAMSMANKMDDNVKADLIADCKYPSTWSPSFLETFLQILVSKQYIIDGIKKGEKTYVELH